MTFVPAYLLLSAPRLWDRVRTAETMLKECSLCPRRCRVDRSAGETGFCKAGSLPLVASWGPHFGEEAPLVGRNGSGTVFFSRCTLGCVFCQNWSISHSGEGREMSCERLAEVFLELQGRGCHNINLVSPTHQMPMILRSLALAAEKGLNVPLVYNCGGYESPEALGMLDGIIDIYMPDFKYADPETARALSKADDYPQAARAAVLEMHRQVGDLLVDEGGIALRGLLVRHLVLPEGKAGTEEVVRFIAEEISKDTYINIMDQYYPCYHADEYPPLGRRTTRKEYDEAIRLALAAGLRRIDGISA
ncbi:MAG: radical SAM protein [Thermodesulfovibrionales bacterium]